MKAENNEIENRKLIENINATKRFFFEEINKNKTLARLIIKYEKKHRLSMSRKRKGTSLQTF